MSGLLCLFLFLFLVFSLYLLYVDGPRSNTQFRPNVTQLGPIFLQPSRGSPSAEHSRLRPSWCPHARPKVFSFLPAPIGPATCCLPCAFCMVSSPSANAPSQQTPLHHANGHPTRIRPSCSDSAMVIRPPYLDSAMMIRPW